MANPKSKRRKKFLIFGLMVLVLGGLAAVALLRKREPVISVKTEKAVRRTLVETVVANGRIQPVVQVKISAEVSGEIIELPVKEGQQVKQGDLLVKIKPDTYLANKRSAEASHQSSLAGRALSEASLRKAELEFKRHEELYRNKLISESAFLEVRTAYEIAQAQDESSRHQVDVSKASLARVEEELAKTTIYSPIAGTVSKLNSEKGERVVGTAMMSGTEIMIIADLNLMEARVDIGEIDIPLIALNQNARLEVDAFRDRKFKGTVSEIANSSKGSGGAGGGSSQEATKFEVRIRVNDQEKFRPGMSVTAEIETRARTNVLAVPTQSVTTRMPKEEKKDKKDGVAHGGTNAPAGTNTVAATNTAAGTNLVAVASAGTNAPADGTNSVKAPKKGEGPKPIEVVFVCTNDVARMIPVKRGISDDAYTEITEGLAEDQEIVSGGFKAISKDLEDGKKVRKGGPDDKEEKPKP